MSNQAYLKTVEAAMAAIAPDDVTIQALDSSYVFDGTDDFADDLTGQLGDPIVLTTVAFTNGVLTADNPTITGLSNGDQIVAFAIYNDTGTPGTSRLLGFIDTDASGAPINFTSDGTNLPLAFPGLTILSY